MVTQARETGDLRGLKLLVGGLGVLVILGTALVIGVVIHRLYAKPAALAPGIIPGVVPGAVPSVIPGAPAALPPAVGSAGRDTSPDHARLNASPAEASRRARVDGSGGTERTMRPRRRQW